jgi:hypothetical protein
MRHLVVACCLLSTAATPAETAEPPSPAAFLGRQPGEDRYLAPYPQVVAYLRALAEASERVAIEDAGLSTLGNPMPVVILTAEANHARLDRYREIARRLANPAGLEPAEIAALVDEGKAIILVSCSIHSTEVGSTQMAMELAYELATTRDPRHLRWLDEAILLVMPSINPDGQVMVVDWYQKHLAGPYEGGAMPWLYHHYVGHDDNRDFYMLTQKETRVVNEVLYHRWFPQVFLDEHQMGSTGPRMFVPPQTDPLAPEVDSLVFRQADLLGTTMSLRLEEAGKTGVGHDMIYDSYWPGGTRNTAWWKNVTGLLTEVASARIATPVWIEPGELRGGEKGLPEYVRRSNFPSPWPGGWWRLRDIMDYEKVATLALLEATAENRAGILANFARMAATAIARGRSEPPYAFVFPADQHDPAAAAWLVELLLRHGVEVHRAPAEFAAGRQRFPAGSHVVLAAQPYRAFLLTMLRPQRYPEVVPYEGGPILPPYDVTSWSLPIAMGVETIEAEVPIATPLERATTAGRPAPALAAAAGGYLVSQAADSAAIAVNRWLASGKRVFRLGEGAADAPAGEFYMPAAEVAAADLERLAGELHLPVRGLDAAPEGLRRQRPVRVGLYKPWVASMDEGWTRFLLERYEFAFQNLHNQEMREGTYRGRVDVLLFPDVEKSILEKGKPESESARRFFAPLPPPYTGGIQSDDDAAAPVKNGGPVLKQWIEEGGTAVALDSSGRFLIELLGLPVTDVLQGVGEERFHAPGSMLRGLVDTAHPLGWGLRPEEALYFADSPAYDTRPPDPRFGRRVVVRYPEDEKDLLVSGYVKGGERLERRAAVVELTVGKGRVILIGFRAQHRAQTHRTFKLLWNALWRAGLEGAP